jgi:tetratricopeptide (TPR) repeat protein
MTKSRIFLFVFIVVSAVGLYLLPRYVVSNNSPEIESQNTANPVSPGTTDDTHAHEIPDSLKADLESLYDSYINAENREKRFIFADSLAEAYKTVGKLDSLAKYSEIRALEVPSLENLISAGNGYYEAFNFAVNPSKRNSLAEKARNYYSRVLEEDPSLLDIKSKLAMTYVTGSEPMTGIMMLREVIEQEPNNELAIYNLGILAITSGQLEKAIERFEKLNELDPENPEANFYLGYCLFELGREQESKPFFKKVQEIGVTGDLLVASEDYLKRIN